MFKWMRMYNEAKPQTKFFVLNWAVYLLAIIITTAYCYARLDFVRSYQPPSTIEAAKKANKQP